jgi:hypothetical protein
MLTISVTEALQLNVSSQVLYPIALAACIFSMQVQAIPFKTTPESFIITIIILILITYVIRLTSRYIIPRWALAKRHTSEGLRSWLKGSREDKAVDSWVPDAGETWRDKLKRDVVRGDA